MRRLLLVLCLLLLGVAAGAQDFIRYYPPQGSTTFDNPIELTSGGYRVLWMPSGLGSGDTLDNIFMGYLAGQAWTESSAGYANVVIGPRAGMNMINAPTGNVLLGYNTGELLTDGIDNMLIGTAAGAFLTTQDWNVFVGYHAGQRMKASANIGIGSQALQGHATLATGTNNIVIGNNSGMTVQGGAQNVVIGTDAFRAITSGTYNTGLGYNSVDAITTGANNTGLGAQACKNVSTGSGNLCAGYNALAASATASDQLNIGKMLWSGPGKALTDAAVATPAVTVAVATNGWIAGEMLWHATSVSGADQLVANGSVRWWGSDTAGTPVCGINKIGTDGEGHAGGANTLVCTWTNVVSTTNCALSVTCTNDLAGSQAITLYPRIDSVVPVAAVFN